MTGPTPRCPVCQRANPTEPCRNCKTLNRIAGLALEETSAMLAWEATRGQPFPVQVAAFDALKAAYDQRVELCRKAIGAGVEPEPPRDLFGGGS